MKQQQKKRKISNIDLEFFYLYQLPNEQFKTKTNATY